MVSYIRDLDKRLLELENRGLSRLCSTSMNLNEQKDLLLNNMLADIKEHTINQLESGMRIKQIYKADQYVLLSQSRKHATPPCPLDTQNDFGIDANSP